MAQHYLSAQRISQPEPAPHASTRIAVWVPAPVPQMFIRNPRGLTRPAQDSILQSGRLKLYEEIK